MKAHPMVEIENEAQLSTRLNIQSVVSQIRSGFTERDTVIRAVGELLSAGEPVPPEIEADSAETRKLLATRRFRDSSG